MESKPEYIIDPVNGNRIYIKYCKIHEVGSTWFQKEPKFVTQISGKKRGWPRNKH